MTLPPPAPLPASQRRRNTAVEQRRELVNLIRDAIAAHPRSQQKALGPSEVGDPCARRIGYKLLDVAETNPRQPAWRPTVGTAVHAWLEHAFRDVMEDGYERFYLEERVTVGTLADGTEVAGSVDVYDRVTATVIDWKIVGEASLRRHRQKMSEQYRTQVHLYGAGYVALGLPVERVMIVMLPQNGELDDCHVWSEAWDPAVAATALTRLDGIKTLTGALGRQALPLLPTADAFCTYCPWFAPGGDSVTGCPGHPARTVPTEAPRTLAAALT